MHRAPIAVANTHAPEYRPSTALLEGPHVILYEYPLNERIRTYLRLECLFARLRELMLRQSPLDHHFALATLFDIVEACNRADLKSEVLKDLERQKQQLAAYRGNPAVVATTLEELLTALGDTYQTLVKQHDKPGDTVNKDDWLSTVRSRMAIPGGSCAFDLPSFHAWMHAPEARRHADLLRWARPLEPLMQSVDLLLRLLRDNAHTETVETHASQFQMPLPRQRDIQLVRVRMDTGLRLVPEISGNRFMLAIRLLHRMDNGQFEPAHEDAVLELALCL